MNRYIVSHQLYADRCTLKFPTPSLAVFRRPGTEDGDLGCLSYTVQPLV